MAFANDYTLGKGKFYFRRFLPNTQTPDVGGYRRLGNIPEATVSRSLEKLEHTSSEGGVNQKDASVDTANDQSLAFTTDNVSMDNLALWFMSTTSQIVEVGGNVVGEVLADVAPEGYYQLGVTTAAPQGARNVSAVVVKKGATTLIEGTDYSVDLKRGLIYIRSGGALAKGDDPTVNYTTPAATRTVILDGNKTIEGELKFFADNPKGSNKDTYWPYVQISPDGDYALIGTDWQSVGFAVAILSPADGRPRSITEVTS